MPALFSRWWKKTTEQLGSGLGASATCRGGGGGGGDGSGGDCDAGGSGADAKLIAARALGLPVLMIDRPAVPGRTECYRPEDVLAWLGHDAEPKAERGV